MVDLGPHRHRSRRIAIVARAATNPAVVIPIEPNFTG